MPQTQYLEQKVRVCKEIKSTLYGLMCSEDNNNAEVEAYRNAYVDAVVRLADAKTELEKAKYPTVWLLKLRANEAVSLGYVSQIEEEIQSYIDAGQWPYVKYEDNRWHLPETYNG